MRAINFKIRNSVILFGLLHLAVLTVGFSETNDMSADNVLSIKLNSKTVILGPHITLGDVGQILVPDSLQRAQLMSVRIGEAPPPGEASDISLSHIKRCLIMAGLEKYIPALIGPRTIRVVTAHIEIDKAFLSEEFVSLYRPPRLQFAEQKNGFFPLIHLFL